MAVALCLRVAATARLWRPTFTTVVLLNKKCAKMWFFVSTSLLGRVISGLSEGCVGGVWRTVIYNTEYCCIILLYYYGDGGVILIASRLYCWVYYHQTEMHKATLIQYYPSTTHRHTYTSTYYSYTFFFQKHEQSCPAAPYWRRRGVLLTQYSV